MRGLNLLIFSFAIQGSDNKEITGLDAICSVDGKNLYGINLESNLWAKAKLIDAPTTLDELAMQKIIDTAELKTGNKINLILCSYATRRKILKGLASSKTIISNEDFGYGFKALNFNGIPIVADRFCGDKKMYLLEINKK